MKRFVYLITALVFLAIGCNNEIFNPNQNSIFTVRIETLTSGSKTSLGPDNDILWSTEDRIAIFQSPEPQKYKLTESSIGTTQGEFVIESQVTEPADGWENIAFYPYRPDLTCKKSDRSYTIDNIHLTTEQQHIDGSFDDSSFLMAAADKDMDLQFKNIIGLIKLQVKGTDIVKSIKLEGKNGELLSGKASVTVYSDGTNPTIQMSDQAIKHITLNCGDGVQLKEETATTFFLVLPPVTFSNGFKVTITTAANETKMLTANVANSVLRSSILTMPEVTLDNENKPEVDITAMNHISFSESDEIIANPERGFYFTQSFNSASASLLTASNIEKNRLQNRTICYLGFYPKEYMNGHISDKFLQMVRKNMQVLRENGAKCIMRFAYSDSENEKPWDPTPEVVQMHIADIKPILQEYSDVIMCLQAGFVGVWGEWYYTENFEFAPSTPEEHTLRKQVADAMLEALPADRSIGLRTPMFKRNMYAESYRDTLTLATAYDGSPKSRVSGFNDCFGASADDYGTFVNDASREYWKKDTRYTLMGGETCGVSSYCECAVTLKDCEDYHWTYMNIEYNQDVHNVWKNGGCWDEIERRLGYRLALTDVYHSTTAIGGNKFKVKISIKNSGFAAPMNGRGVELILVGGNDEKTIYDLSEEVDPRYWFADGTYTFEKIIQLPEEAEGEHTMYLNLPDPKSTLHDNPKFSIRLANSGVWNKDTGYNKLFNFTILAKGSTPEPAPGDWTGGMGEDITFGQEFNPWR